MRRNRFLGVSMATLAMFAASLGGQMVNLLPTKQVAVMPAMPAISKPPKRRKRTTSHGRNGKREVERRLRQIANGQLTRSNGLVSAEELFGRIAA